MLEVAPAVGIVSVLVCMNSTGTGGVGDLNDIMGVAVACLAGERFILGEVGSMLIDAEGTGDGEGDGPRVTGEVVRLGERERRWKKPLVFFLNLENLDGGSMGCEERRAWMR